MRTGVKSAIISLYRDLALRTGINARTIFGVYDYMFDPRQLRFLMDCILDTASIPGCCVEAGCARGGTTAFLRKWMDIEGIRKDYIALDTFSGFVPSHAEYEIQSRRKSTAIRDAFSNNKKAWFDYSMKLANVTGVTSIEVDVAEFNFDSISPISFCLLDVDLYLPSKQCLPRIYDNMSPGGIIVVDDCESEKIYDGAMQAYEEFVVDIGVPKKIECGKLGVIHKA
jgi:O-methyltransferase